MRAHHLFLDIETYSETPIVHGVARYAIGAEVMLLAYALDDEAVQVWDLVAGEPMPHDLRALMADAAVTVVAHNYLFEQTLLRETGIADIPVERWHCTLAQALQHGLPGGLERLCAIFKVAEDDAKQAADSRRLIHLFCRPRPKNMKLRRATRHTHPQDWEKFKRYCASDVTAMRVVARKLPTWNLQQAEREAFELDGRINVRGVLLDVELARATVAATEAEQARLSARTADATQGEVQSTRQVSALLGHIAEHYDLTLPDLRAGTVEKALAAADLPAEVGELLLLRAQASRSSAAKYAVAVNATVNGRLHGALQFCGAARTGRWAGRQFQPQNMPRPRIGDLRDEALQAAITFGIEALKAGCADLVVDNVMELAAAAVRGLVIAPPGRKLVVCDLSNIEGRALAWLADEEWKLQAFREFDAGTGPDLYKLAYARSFNKRVEEVDKSERFIGKVQELALGYQGAVGAFGSMAALYGVTLPEDEILRIVTAWRKANSRIAGLWRAVETAARSAVLNPGEDFAAGVLVFDRHGAWLRCRLPSGRFLCYPSPMLNSDTGKLTYMGVDPYTKQFKRLATYGGKLVENATQAVARDILARSMPRIERAGFAIVLTVHDEVLTEAPASTDFSVARLASLMTEGEPWSSGLPLAAAGFEADRYRKE